MKKLVKLALIIGVIVVLAKVVAAKKAKRVGGSPLIIKGPGVANTGTVLNSVAHVMDIAPTVLHMFGLPVPKDMDGRVLTEIFKKESEPGQREVAYQEIDYEAERIRLKAKKKLPPRIKKTSSEDGISSQLFS